MHLTPFRNNFIPSRRHRRHTGPEYFATSLPPLFQKFLSVSITMVFQRPCSQAYPLNQAFIFSDIHARVSLTLAGVSAVDSHYEEWVSHL